MTFGSLPNAVRRTIGDRVYYFGSITSDKVKGVTFVPVLEQSPKTPLVEVTEGGYQRPGSMPRMNKFKNFLKANPESLVPPVLLSGRGQWQFVPQADGSQIGTMEILGAAAILDGQHRLGGYVALFETEGDVRSIDFLLLDNLSLSEEVREFVIVNNTQVGVPKSLNFFLAAGVEGLDEIVGDYSDETWIAWQMTVREDSPFFGRITRTKMGPEHLFQLHSVAKSLQRMFDDGAFSDVDREEKAEIAIRYWNLIIDHQPNEAADMEKLGVPKQGRKAFQYKLLELTGFIAWSLIGNHRILPSSYNAASHTLDWDRVERIVEMLAERIDWRKEGEYRDATGEVGGPRICKDMEKVIALNPI